MIATGSQAVLGIGPELGFGIPGGALLGYDSLLPIVGALVGTEADTAQQQRSGYLKAGVPGGKGGGAFEWGHPLGPAHLLEPMAHLCSGPVVKTSPEAGVQVYDFVPVLGGGIMPSMSAHIGAEPVDRWRLFGIKYAELGLNIGNANQEIPLTCKGLAQHGTRLGSAISEAGNLGPYPYLPQVRGPLENEAAGDVWIRITRDVAGGGLQYRLEQSAALPAFGGSDINAVYDEHGRAAWQDAQGADGFDLGLVEGDLKDHLQVVFPGTAAEHAQLAVGDTWHWPAPGAWTSPAMPLVTGAPRFTSAHWLSRVRDIGAAGWIESNVNTGAITLAVDLELDGGNRTRYPFDILRIGRFRPKVTLSKTFTSRWFQERSDRHKRVEMQHAWEGEQIGISGAYRQSIQITFGRAMFTRTVAIQDEGKISEGFEFRGETDETGIVPPFTVRITTDRDWTPAVYPF